MKQAHIKNHRCLKATVLLFVLVFYSEHADAYKPFPLPSQIQKHESYNEFVARQIEKSFPLKGNKVIRANAAKYVREVTVIISLTEDGTIDSMNVLVQSISANVESKNYIESLKHQIKSAVKRWSPYSALPANKYDEWRVVAIVYSF